MKWSEWLIFFRNDGQLPIIYQTDRKRQLKIRPKDLIILVSPKQSDRKGNNKVSKCKLNKYLFGKKNQRKTGVFRCSMTITNSPLVEQPIKMQDLHQSTSWVILIDLNSKVWILICSIVASSDSSLLFQLQFLWSRLLSLPLKTDVK